MARSERAESLAREIATVRPRGSSRPLARLAQNERALREACEQSLSAAAERAPSPKAAWLLDNYSFLQSQIREIREGMPRAFCRQLPVIDDEPRVYRLAVELAASPIELEDITQFVNAFQEIAPLVLAEVWAIGPMLKLALIEKLRAGLDAPDADETAVREAIVALRALETASWRDFVESVSLVERILREDPAGVYTGMDFETRDAYRHVVEGIARHGDLDETGVAALAVKLADSKAAGRERHVGYYLVGPGRNTLRQRAGYRSSISGRLREAVYRRPNALYFGGIALVTSLLIAAVYAVLPHAPLWLAALLLVPASQAALAFMNPLVNHLLPPRRLPRLDFSQGIPDDCRTFVVVPTLLLSRAGVERLLEQPGNPLPRQSRSEPVVRAADGLRRFAPRLRPQTTTCSISARKESSCSTRATVRPSGSPFYLFHRRREWNECEGVWMGHERKRGKLDDFNRLLLGGDDSFSLKTGDLAASVSFRYVITLDSDTQLPRDTARKLIATLAHPLNRPVIDARHNGSRRLRASSSRASRSAWNRPAARAWRVLQRADGLRPLHHGRLRRLPGPARPGELHRQRHLRPARLRRAHWAAASPITPCSATTSSRASTRALRLVTDLEIHRRLPGEIPGLVETEAPLGAGRLADRKLAAAGAFRQPRVAVNPTLFRRFPAGKSPIISGAACSKSPCSP